MNEILITRFLIDWYTWALNGAPEHRYCDGGFTREFGLCYNFEHWCYRNGISFCETDTTNHFHQSETLAFTFNEWLGWQHYPFGGRDEYKCRQQYDDQHTNPARLAWVFAHIG